jgi:hypothetical protein
MSSSGEKKKHKLYKDESMLAAIADVKEHGTKVKVAANTHAVPYTTLRDRLKGLHTGKVGGKQTLKDEEELALVDWILSWAKMGQPMEKSQILKAAGRIAQTHQPGEKKFEGIGMEAFMMFIA